MSEIDAYLSMQSLSREEFRERMAKELMHVGVQKFHDEHLDLLAHFLKFQTAMEDFRIGETPDKDWDTVEEMLDFMTDYVERHFTAEEAFLQKNSYPKILRHRNAHSQFSDMLADYKKAFQTKDHKKLLGLKYDLFGWFFDHINKLDVDYKQYA